MNNSPLEIQNPKLFRQQLAAWFRANGRDLPWRRTTDPYAILVSEFMLQQTQVATVIPYYERWLARFPNFSVLGAADESDVLHAWQGLGYYARARNLHRAARAVVELHGGEFPTDPVAIAALPGIGRYTAGAVASFAFDRPVATVDANIARVLARLFNIQEPVDSTRGAAAVWSAAEALLPACGGCIYTSALMELGALVCIPRRPQCLICPVRGHCRATEPELLPLKKPRRKTVALDENCGWIVANGALLLELQTGSRWGGLWKLPRIAPPPLTSFPLTQLEYPFTHHRVTLRVFEQPAPEGVLGPDQRWYEITRLDEVALAAPHRRAICALVEGMKT